MKVAINLVVLGIFGLASVNGLMQEKFVPYETVVFGCDPLEIAVFYTPSYPYPSSPVYFCPASD